MANPFIQKYLKREPEASAVSQPQASGVSPINKDDPFAKGITEARTAGHSDEAINEHLKKQGKFSTTLNPVEQGGANKVSDFLGSTKFGQYIAQNLFKGTEEAQGLRDATGSLENSMFKLDEQIQKNQSIGKDTSRLENLKMQLQFDLQKAQYTSQQLEGGTSGREAFGSAVQTVAAGVPFTGLVGKGLTKAGAPLGAKLTGISTKSTVGANALEGALGGFTYGVGSGIEKGKGVGGTLGEGALTGAGGAVAGPLVGAAFKGASKVFGKSTPKPPTKPVPGKVLNKVNEALGFKKKTSEQVFESIYGTKGTESPRMKWVDELANIEDMQVYQINKKKADLVKFDPRTADMGGYFQANRNSMIKISDEISDGLKQLDDAVAQNAQDPVMLKKYTETYNKAMAGIDDIIGSSRFDKAQKKVGTDILEEVKSRKNLSELNDYVSGSLSENISGALTGKEKSAQKISREIKKILVDMTDEYSKITPDAPSIGDMRGRYGAFKSVQDEIISQLPKEIDVVTLDPYGVSNVAAGALFGNLAQIGKGTAFSSINLLSKILGTPKTKLNSAFKLHMGAKAIVPPALLEKVPKEDQEAAKIIADGLEKGSISVAALTALSALPGMAFLKGWAENIEGETFEREEVSPTELIDIDSAKEGVALRESRGETEPYTAVNKSDSEFGDALGKYQARELTLKEWSKRFLGKKVSPQEFLNSPDLQEAFFEAAMERFEEEYGVTDTEHAMALWHLGWGPTNVNKERDAIVKEAEEYLKEPTN